MFYQADFEQVTSDSLVEMIWKPAVGFKLEELLGYQEYFVFSFRKES